MMSMTTTQIQAEARRLRRARGSVDAFAPYRYDPERYIRERLGWSPWRGTAAAPGQADVLDAYVAALQAQHEHPGTPAKNRIRIEAGHTVGKTKMASGLVNHFFDCFTPSIIYTFAPTWEQIHDLLWKEIKADRRGKGLPGRILDLALQVSDDHFVKGKATSNAGGAGSERVQGQHGQYLMFVLDEAEGIDDYVWDAVDSMTSGGVSIVLMLANPRTRGSAFYRAREHANVVNFRLSCLGHPNVLTGQERVPGAVKRLWVEEMMAAHCEVVTVHDPDRHTFAVPWRPGVLYCPKDDGEFLYRVMGIAPRHSSDTTFVPTGRYHAACKREPVPHNAHEARMGVDVARYGKDYGTLYIRHNGALWRAAQFRQQDTTAYKEWIKAEALTLVGQGVTSIHVRVDGSGGFGGGVIDQLKIDQELAQALTDFQVLEVQFGGAAHDGTLYADCVTDLYAELGETLKGLAIVDPPAFLEADVCERNYQIVNVAGRSVKRLEPKEAFRKRKRRSPDDGDGAALAAAPDHIFTKEITLRWLD